MKTKPLLYAFLVLFSVLIYNSCREDEYVIQSEVEEITVPDTIIIRNSDTIGIKGFYVLNEGNMGSNKCTLDYFDYETGKYHRNIYADANPSVVKELGDVGNDIKIYGSKLYAVINCSHKIEVLDAATTKRITHIDLQNCRYMAFHNGKAYASSYAGPVQIDPKAPLGKVVEIDTATLKITREVTVGYQPEEMVIHNNKLYVANSGGYKYPDYDRTVSVVDLTSFTEVKKIDVGINLHRIKIDRRGDIYVSSRGDYYDIPSNLYVIDSKNDEVKQTLDIAVSNMHIDGDSLYLYGTEFSYWTGGWKISYGILDTKTKKLLTDNFIKDGTEKSIRMPYGIMVNPVTKDIYVTDAQNFVSTGFVYCFTPDGKMKWKTAGGNIPAHFVFEYKIEYEDEEIIINP